MDLGTMTKKLKTLTYKSKAEFVADLNLIWDNCLKYNADIQHPLRRNANSMRKEAEKLVPLIPDLAIRPRAEVEAEERRKQNGGEDDGGDDSDDEPIMSSRGRKAGAKGSKARKAHPDRDEGTPGIDQKPSLQLNGLLGKLGHEGSDAGMDGSQNGFATPPIGSITPSGMNGIPGLGSQADGMDIDGPSINGLSLGQALGAVADDLQEDEEYKIWKQVTKKDRALVAKERNRLFRGDKLNIDEPALLRTKAGMRRWLRQQKQAQSDATRSDANAKGAKDAIQGVETLAEGMEGEEERVLPDYYDSLSAVPDIPPKLQWVEDADGQLIDRSDEFLRMVPSGHFTAPKSFLTGKVEANMRQMQETRKLCSKIGVIKQMQLQAQVNLSQKSLCLKANPLRCTIINSPNTNQNHSSKQTLNLMSSQMMDPSWLLGFAKPPCNDRWRNFAITLDSRNFSPALWTSSPTLLETSLLSLCKHSMFIAKRPRCRQLGQLQKLEQSGKRHSPTKKLSFTH
jgi:transcriptional activator SPT7